MTSQTLWMRSLSTICRTEMGRLNKLADSFDDVGFKDHAKKFRKMATDCGATALALSVAADKARDNRGAKRAKAWLSENRSSANG